MKKTLTICALLLAVLGGSVAAYADAGGDFTIYPSHTHQGNKNWVIRSATPGEVIDEHLILENLSDDRLEISLFVREAEEEDGRFAVSASTDFLDIGGWITPEISSYTLEPHRNVEIPVLISVPADAAYGKYTAAIFASKKDSAGASLNIVTQIGVRVYLDVTPSSDGYANIFATPEYKSIFLMGLSVLGLGSSIFYYLINRGGKKHAK